MQVIQLPAFGLDRLEIVTTATPEPAPGEVLVRFAAAAVNYRDYQIVIGEFAPTAGLPIVPCSDGAAEIAAVGEGVTDLAPGDLVCPLFFPDWQQGEALAAERSISSGLEAPGVLREYGIYRPDQLVKAAKNLSPAQAACFPCAGLTAWNCVSTLAGIGPGDWVLAQGTGGVAIFALQFAKALGAHVIITSASDQKLERARELGADFGINYLKTPEWGVQAREVTGGRGVHCVVEIGGEGTLPQSVTALRRGGHIGIVGYLAGLGLGLTVIDLIERNAHLHGVSVGNREDFVAMMAFVEEHGITPVISAEYPFEQAAAALGDIAAGEHFGKLVIGI